LQKFDVSTYPYRADTDTPIRISAT